MPHGPLGEHPHNDGALTVAKTPKVGNIPAALDLDIYQGDTFRRTLTLRAAGELIDLTGCTARAQIRKTKKSETVVAEIELSILTPLAGEIEMVLEAPVAAAIPCGEKETDQASKYVWDLELVDSLGDPRTLFRGVVTVFAEATR